jgi:hypothetical protein
MFMTPRGYPVAIPLEPGFGMIARIWKQDPTKDAFYFLKMVEGICDLPSVVGFLSGLGAMFAWTNPFAIAGAVTGGYLLGAAIGAYMIPVPFALLRLAVAWTYFSGFGVLFLASMGLVLWRAGIWGCAGYALGVAAGAVLQYPLVRIPAGRRQIRLAGHPFRDTEFAFLNAYRVLSGRVGLSADESAERTESGGTAWEECLADYATRYPEAVARFLDQETMLRLLLSR